MREKAPAELGSRACTCSFCAPRRIRWTSDPAGRIEVSAREAELSRYRFGTGTAVMLDCGTFGRGAVVRWQNGEFLGLSFDSELNAQEVSALIDRSNALSARMKTRE